MLLICISKSSSFIVCKHVYTRWNAYICLCCWINKYDTFIFSHSQKSVMWMWKFSLCVCARVFAALLCNSLGFWWCTFIESNRTSIEIWFLPSSEAIWTGGPLECNLNHRTYYTCDSQQITELNDTSKDCKYNGPMTVEERSAETLPNHFAAEYKIQHPKINHTCARVRTYV